LNAGPSPERQPAARILCKFPNWFHILAALAICLGLLSAFVIFVDVLRHPQHMAIMNVVWPVTALFGTIPLVLAYFAYGRLTSHDAIAEAKNRGEEMPGEIETPFPPMVGKGHCIVEAVA